MLQDGYQCKVYSTNLKKGLMFAAKITVPDVSEVIESTSTIHYEAAIAASVALLLCIVLGVVAIFLYRRRGEVYYML